MALDPLHRDGAARILSWTWSAHKVTTPAAFAVQVSGIPAPPADALTLTLDMAGGSLFAPRNGPFLPDDLPYAPAAGAALLAAGHALHVERHQAGRAFVLVDPAGAVPDDVEVVALGTARAYVDNPYHLTKAITTARANVGPERLLYLPGVGLPHEIAVLAYAGVDLFDDAAAVLAARAGGYVTPEGVLPASAVDEGVDLVAHARAAVQSELARVRAAIRAGKLRELVEQRSRATPDLAAHLRRFDKEAYDFFEPRMPLLRPAPMFATSKESIERPEVERFRRRMVARYRKPTAARILVLLPCSAQKPYGESKTHRILETALARVRNRFAVHEVILTSPLGVVPRELERCYPAAHYDLPVTGHWDEDEKLMIRDALAALVEHSRYDAIVVHLDEVEMEIAKPALPDFHYTVEKSQPLSHESLDNLAQTLNKLADATPRVGWMARALDELSAIAKFQFGEAGHALVEGADIKGRAPYLRLVDGATGVQLAMLVPDRGYLSLAPEGGKRLLEAGWKAHVEIDDFRPKGTVFAVGVRGADADIRPEDEVALVHGAQFRGVGRALVTGAEMGRMKRGACVAVRHKEGGAPP